MKIECYEISNTFTPDLSLEEQIEQGICDWRAELEDDSVFGGYRVAFGRTRDEAIRNLRG